ncbi:MAG: HPP family protein [Patescibacteria group bacterium]
MKVDQVMSRKIILVALDTPFRDLWQIIFKKRINAAPVVDKSKKLFGIITRDDMLRFLYPDYSEFIAEFSAPRDFEEMEEKIHDLLPLKASDMMCKRVIYTRTDTPIMRALSRMIVRSVNQLPVLDDNDRVVGIITKGDIFYALFRRHLSHPKPKRRTKRRK